MANKFAVSEIAELGVQIEINGRDFYAGLTDKTKNVKVKEVFSYLRGEEEKHIAKFREILDSVHKYEPKEAYPDEYFAHMNSLAGAHVFTKKNKGRETAERMKDSKEAVDFGLKFERDSILFYVGMKKTLSKEDQAVIDRLIKEEESHIRKLLDLRKKIEGEKET